MLISLGSWTQKLSPILSPRQQHIWKVWSQTTVYFSGRSMSSLSSLFHFLPTVSWRAGQPLIFPRLHDDRSCLMPYSGFLLCSSTSLSLSLYLPSWPHHAASLTQLLQMPETPSTWLLWCKKGGKHRWGLCTVKVVAQGGCRTVNEADSLCRRDSVRTYSLVKTIPRVELTSWMWMSWTDTAQEPDSTDLICVH